MEQCGNGARCFMRFVREHGLTYSVFIGGLIKAGIELDRKTLSAMAIDDAASFAAVVETVKGVLGAEAKAA